MLARRFLFLSGILALSLMMLGAIPMRPLPGNARPYRSDSPAIRADFARQEAIAELAAGVSAPYQNWEAIAAALEARAERELGPLSPMDRYWLGSAWWGTHQPERHLTRPRWAPRTAADPALVLRHPEGGNCESSSNGHAALLNALGVPTVPVYGYHFGARESHVWTMSDVDGSLMLADVHLARNSEGVWKPKARDVMAEPTREAAEAFLRLRKPDNAAQAGVLSGNRPGVAGSR